MAAKTSISWTQQSWNHIRGCSRKSEGCRNCYAEVTANRFSAPGKPYHGLVTSKLRVIENVSYSFPQWTGVVRFIPEELCTPMFWRKPQLVFVNSMSDLFHEKVSFEVIAATFGIMLLCGRHTFQLLTKRAERMPEFFAWLEEQCENGSHPPAVCVAAALKLAPEHHKGYILRAMEASDLHQWPAPNVWLGVSTENQSTADDRIPFLLSVPAAVHFLSCEPLLGPIDLERFAFGRCSEHDFESGFCVPRSNRCVNHIRWVIAGCESGSRARECDIAWLRELRDWCTKYNRKFWLKQAKELGTMPSTEADLPAENCDASGEPFVHAIDKTFNDPPTAPRRKKRGVIERPYLDGKQWLEMPDR